MQPESSAVILLYMAMIGAGLVIAAAIAIAVTDNLYKTLKRKK
jgi:hypothetical protein